MINGDKKAKVVVSNLTRKFGDLLVLDDLSFTVGEGEFLSIVGPTGCGKTTFLNCLSRLLPPTKGNIFIDGELADPKKHNISFVFQEPTPMPWRTVEENVSFGMEIKGFPKDKMRERLNYIMALVGLSDTAHLYPNQISASMMQRLTVARAFAVDPDLLLMDEPYGQLTVKLRYYLEDELIKLWQTLKSTVIFITHNIEEAVYLAERILVLSNKPAKIKAEIKVNLPHPRKLIDPQFLVPSTMLAAPSSVFQLFLVKLTDPNPDGAVLSAHVWISIQEAGIGYLLSLLIGLPLGLLMGWFTVVRGVFRPLFEIIRPIPPIAWIPLYIFWFGIDLWGKVFIIWIGGVVPCVINAWAGVKMTNPTLIQMARTYGATDWQIFKKLCIPSALPMVFGALQITLAICWTNLVAAELLASDSGLGFLISMGRRLALPEMVVLAMVTVGVVGALIGLAIDAVEKRLLAGIRR
ncbi:MAG: ATP-binding cassette domain-containing protein [Deltaproteobacteria bacterium]|nr:ATP-binding cassette domain-containing protein [Deltaproteobacteria bacterium]